MGAPGAKMGAPGAQEGLKLAASASGSGIPTSFAFVYCNSREKGF